MACHLYVCHNMYHKFRHAISPWKPKSGQKVSNATRPQGWNQQCCLNSQAKLELSGIGPFGHVSLKRRSLYIYSSPLRKGTKARGGSCNNIYTQLMIHSPMNQTTLC